MAEGCTLTLDEVREVLQKRGGGLLRSGGHNAPPSDDEPCEMCVEELRALACGLPWSAHPGSETETPTHRVCQGLNDANWSSDAARTAACLPLALLSEEMAPQGWGIRLCEQIVRQIVPIALRAAAEVRPDDDHKAAMLIAAMKCEQEGTAASADWAASAARAASAASADWAASAARAASADWADWADWAASADWADWADSDKVLVLAVHLVLRAHGREDLVR